MTVLRKAVESWIFKVVTPLLLTAVLGLGGIIVNQFDTRVSANETRIEENTKDHIRICDKYDAKVGPGDLARVLDRQDKILERQGKTLDNITLIQIQQGVMLQRMKDMDEDIRELKGRNP